VYWFVDAVRDVDVPGAVGGQAGLPTNTVSLCLDDPSLAGRASRSVDGASMRTVGTRTRGRSGCPRFPRAGRGVHRNRLAPWQDRGVLGRCRRAGLWTTYLPN